MFSLIKTSIFGMAAIVTLQAGQIQIGAGSNGLTSSYIASSTTSSCSGNTNAYSTGQAGYNGCLAVTQGAGVVQRNYVATLFQNASGATAPAGTTITDAANGNVTFNRIQGDLATGQAVGADFWATSASPPSSVIVPVGIYGVDKAWTMLNDYWGGDGEVGNMVVTFRWDDSSNGTGGVTAAYNEVYNLKNGETVRSAVACASSAPAACKTLSGAIPISTSLDLLVNHGGVTANNVFTDASGNSLGATAAVGSRYVNQSGLTLQLDNQMFSFGTAHLNEFLVSITIANQITSGYTGAANGSSNTRAALSAVTVNQVVPEPGTVFLALAGLGAVGYFRRRKA